MNKKIISIIAIITLIAMLTVCLVACNASSYEKKLKKAGYEVETIDVEELDGNEDDVKWIVSGYNEKTDDWVTIYKFKKISDAKDFVEDIEDYIDAEGCSVKRSSSIVFVGTEQAIKDAK